ncbi:MAG: ATPase, T2SS/T4P/T4SS family [Gammaproteobacteria bacterium]|nr:ATPase, T2SS/T4P/T4SS family [Gammaproteobacteria bacterium]
MKPFSDVPLPLNRLAINDALIHAVDAGASDIHFLSNAPIIAGVHGKMLPLIQRRIQSHELRGLLDEMLGEYALPTIAKAQAVNTSYQLRRNRDETLRFRVNAMGCMIDGVDGIQMTFRYIPSEPPSIESLQVEPEIVAHSQVQQGLIAVTGSTGSGKSTLLAAMIRQRLENPHSHEKIQTFESPIEFVYYGIERHNNVITQCEIPRHLPSFTQGVSEALRSAPTTILVGEARDKETISECCVFAQTGHLVLTTVHTNSVAETLQRMVSIFPANERSFQTAGLIDSFQLIVTQRLVPDTHGQRVAIREYLPFNPQVRQRLFNADASHFSAIVRSLVEEFGRPMIAHANERLRDGLIDRYTYDLIGKSYG